MKDLKFKARITKVCPERDLNTARTEVFKEPAFTILKSRTKSTEQSLRDETSSEQEQKFTETKELVYQFPKKDVDVYLEKLWETKMRGVFNETRKCFDTMKTPAQGGLKGLGTVWNYTDIKVKVTDKGKLLKSERVKSFEFNNGKGIGKVYSDCYDHMDVEVDLNNTAIPEKVMEQVVDWITKNNGCGPNRCSTIRKIFV